MKNIFQNASLGNLILKNRLIRSATWENLAEIDGSIDEKTYKIYDELAKGGVGAIITGFTSVLTNDYYFGGMMRLSEDFLIPQYKKLTEIVHAENCKIISQLALGAFYKNSVEIPENNLSKVEIKYIIQNFIAAAIRAEKCGFDGVQIHAAHFFFLSRFISPIFNQNENRIEILLKILQGIKNSTNLHVTIKINSSDFIDGGLNFEESLKICKILAENGIDSIEVSGNGTSIAGIKAGVNEGYFSKFAAKLADEVEIPIICVGGWRSLAEMEKILRDTKIEFLSLSRPLIREPNLPQKFLKGETKISKCISCNACYSTPAHRCRFEK
ncbi:MAG: NADH:flavin oxidoreductase [Selenomonadaceae bacterium]|nr:NADH:flavin oxidoreductase [Selenomonadaceae bacterium]